MRFSDKLFFIITALVTAIFTIFGTWILNSFYSEILKRELEQGSVESQMFQYVFEMAYEGVPEEYGREYALRRSMESAVRNLNKADSLYYIFAETYEQLYGGFEAEEYPVREAIVSIMSGLGSHFNYGEQIVDTERGYYMVSVARSECKDTIYYLAVSKDITSIYQYREVLLNQYRFVLALLLLLSTIVIFLISRYLTRPIQRLTVTAAAITAGDLTVRDENTSQDEIGELSRSFDHMADSLVERVREKEAEAKRKAKEAKQQEDFTAAFAHELKTPLTSIIGYADMLATIPMSEAERSEAAYYIFTQGKRLESLSHKLLELVSLEKGSFAFRMISAKELEENIRYTIRPMLVSKKIRGRVILEKSRIYGDKDLILSLLYNLLDNAGKAVEPGGFILLKGTRTEQGYEFKVVDNGRGIPREEINRITEAFYMVDKSRSRKEGGAGIGMTLCRKIVTLHGGTMQIDSKPGEGTVVKIILPERIKQEQEGKGNA